MNEASKDSRITDLFTKGSHHRNLSTILIMQNHYCPGTVTLRRNAHYLILFNMPADRQMIKTMSHRMFPNNPHHMLEKYNQAISKPYGYLLVDLKPQTPETERLQMDIFPQKQCKRSLSLESNIQMSGHASSYSEKLKRCEEVYKKNHDTYSDKSGSTESLNSFNTESFKMPTCDFCGLLFATVSDLQYHLTDWCKGQRKRPRQDDDEYGSAKRRHINKHSAETFNVKREKRLIRLLAEIVSTRMEENLEERQSDYENEGESSQRAQDLALNDLVSDFRRELREAYGEFCTTWMNLQEKSFLFKILMKTASKLHDKHQYTWEDAFKQAVRQHKELLNKLVKEREIEDEETEGEEETETESETEREETGEEEEGEEEEEEEEEGTESEDDGNR